MSSPQEYKQRIEQIIGINFEKDTLHLRYHWDTPAEGKILLAKIRIIQKEFRLLRKELTFDIQSIRSSYIASKASVGSGGGYTLSSLLFGKRATGRANSIERELLRQKQQNHLAPYESIKRVLDQLLLQLDKIKIQIDSE